MAAQAQLCTAGKVNIIPGMKTVDLPAHGYFSKDSPDKQTINLVKTGTGGISPSVPVFNAVRDNATGLDKITLPAVGSEPPRTILINPVPTGPSVPAHTGNSSPGPSIPVHTGSDIKQADSIVTTSSLGVEIPCICDFIYWQPDATGTGVEPIYVMTNGVYGESNATGTYSSRPYNTEKAGGPIENLDWRSASIDRAGVDEVKLHTGRFHLPRKIM